MADESPKHASSYSDFYGTRIACRMNTDSNAKCENLPAGETASNKLLVGTKYSLKSLGVIQSDATTCWMITKREYDLYIKTENYITDKFSEVLD
jgi:hypothetical protein